MGLHRSAVYLYGIIVLLLVFNCDSASAVFYRNHTLKDWCDPHMILKVVRRLINQPNDLFVTRENALEITHRWDSTYNKECVFSVEAGRDSGLILNVNQMFLRSENRNDPLLGNCMDYFRLRYKNGTKSQRMCGMANATTSTLASRSFVVPDGKVEIKIKIDDIRNLRAREYLYVDFLFTQFDDCRLTNSFTCAEKTCIHEKYVNDGNINCPYPKCLDESSCYNKTSVIPQVNSSKRAIIGGIAAAVVLAVLIPITICCCCEFCRKGAVSGRRHNRRGGGASSADPTSSSTNSSGENRSGRRHRDRSNRRGSRGNRNVADHLRGAENGMRPQDIGFTAIVSSSPPPPLEEQKESPPPTYESLFPAR